MTPNTSNSGETAAEALRGAAEAAPVERAPATASRSRGWLVRACHPGRRHRVEADRVRAGGDLLPRFRRLRRPGRLEPRGPPLRRDGARLDPARPPARLTYPTEERASRSTLRGHAGSSTSSRSSAFLFFAGAWVTGLTRPVPVEVAHLLGARHRPRDGRARRCALLHAARVHPERRHRRRRRGRPARRAEDPRPPRVRRERCRLRRRGVRARLGGDQRRRRHQDAEELPEIVRSHEIERVVVAFFDQPIDEAIDLVRGVKDIRPSDRHRSAALRGRRSRRRFTRSKGSRSSDCPGPSLAVVFVVKRAARPSSSPGSASSSSRSLSGDRRSSSSSFAGPGLLPARARRRTAGASG